MPTYQYACTAAACGHTFEQFQSFSEDSLTTCPRCDGRLRKVFNAVGVVFKGSGFYRTDSRSNGGAGQGDKSSAGSGEGSSAAKDSSGGSSDSSTTTSTTSSGTKSTGTGSSSSTATAGAGAA